MVNAPRPKGTFIFISPVRVGFGRFEFEIDARIGKTEIRGMTSAVHIGRERIHQTLALDMLRGGFPGVYRVDSHKDLTPAMSKKLAAALVVEMKNVKKAGWH